MKPAQKIIGVLILIAVLGTFAGFWRLGSGSANGIQLMPDDPHTVARGKILYDKNCSSCHGQHLQGQPDWRVRGSNGRVPAPPHDETGHTWHHPDWQLFQLTKYGPEKLVGNGYVSDMPGYQGTLSDEQIIEVLSYIKSTWPDEIRAKNDLVNERMKQPG